MGLSTIQMSESRVNTLEAHPPNEFDDRPLVAAARRDALRLAHYTSDMSLKSTATPTSACVTRRRRRMPQV